MPEPPSATPGSGHREDLAVLSGAGRRRGPAPAALRPEPAPHPPSRPLFVPLPSSAPLTAASSSRRGRRPQAPRRIARSAPAPPRALPRLGDSLPVGAPRAAAADEFPGRRPELLPPLPIADRGRREGGEERAGAVRRRRRLAGGC